MVKFNLQKCLTPVVAAASIIILSSCKNNLNSISSEAPESAIITLAPIEPTPYIGIVNNKEFNIEELWEIKQDDFVFNPNLSAVVPIGEIELSNGEIAYIMPKDYIPYLIDKTKPMPEYTEEIEMDGYVFKYAVPITYASGGKGYLDYSGAVAIYLPYYNALKLLQDHKSSYYKYLYDLENNYGKDSYQYKLIAAALELEDLAKEIYYSDINGYGR